MWIWVILLGVATLVAYIQFAPSDANRWHARVEASKNMDFSAGAVRVVAADMAKLDRIIRDSGAKVLAGSVEDGLITYISRSRIVRFPDYTTVQDKGDVLAIYGRLRFGKSDLAVNRKRIEGWLAQL